MRLFEVLDTWIPETDPVGFGQLVLSRNGDGFVARHVDDSGEDPGELKRLESLSEVRQMAARDVNDQERILPTAPSLVGGWIITSDRAEEFYGLIDAIYPAVLERTIGYLGGQLDPVPLRETLDRQSGAGAITDAKANAIMRSTCAAGCLRTITWPIDDRSPVSRLGRTTDRRIPLLCTEACSVAIAEACRMDG